MSTCSTWRCGRGACRPNGPAWQQQVRSRARQGPEGRRRSDRGRLRRRKSIGLTARSRRRRPANGVGKCCSGSPRASRPTHEFVRTGQDDSKFGVRHRQRGGGRGGHPAPPPRLAGRTGRDPPISAARSSSCGRSSGRQACWRSSSTPLGLEELCVGGGLGVATWKGKWRRRSASGPPPCTPLRPPPGSVGALDRRTRPGRRGRGRHHVLHVGRPPVVFVCDGVAHTVVRQETEEDLLSLDVDR